ncbi:MAG TPA: RNA polymerase sigma-70 factor [Bacteroidales bacterium]|nr:RNA polymerase sigma-70 factor [Bacteroidales bacterium]
MTSDSEIIRRIRQGDKGQFESLFRSSYVSLVRYARSIVKDHDSAEEIVQDLFVRFWQDRQKINIESTLKGYLFRAVHNRCLHWLNHARVVDNHAGEMSAVEPEKAETPVEIIQYNELQLRIAEVIERLPERCGQIFCMSRFEGLKYTEIADKLSISVKTVEANMGRALKEFRKALIEK